MSLIGLAFPTNRGKPSNFRAPTQSNTLSKMVESHDALIVSPQK